ncbi:hypothetical protein ACWGOK_39780, partial [Streptomyces eurythermus]
MTQLLRVQNFNVSSDGIGAGEDQSFENPFGHGIDPAKLFAWAGATASALAGNVHRFAMDERKDGQGGTDVWATALR